MRSRVISVLFLIYSHLLAKYLADSKSKHSKCLLSQQLFEKWFPLQNLEGEGIYRYTFEICTFENTILLFQQSIFQRQCLFLHPHKQILGVCNLIFIPFSCCSSSPSFRTLHCIKALLLHESVSHTSHILARNINACKKQFLVFSASYGAWCNMMSTANV